MTAIQIGTPAAAAKYMTKGVERVDHADRQVELAADEHEDLAGGDDRRRCRELDEVDEVGA